MNQVLRQNNRPNGTMGQMGGEQMGQNELTTRDRAVREAVSDLYMALGQQADPNTAIDMLAEHVAMMVEMINEFKRQR